jgi:dihydroorotase (multifunctional complex type)
MTFDLAIRGGRVISPIRMLDANVYVAEGKVAAVTPDAHSATNEVDAAGLLVFPGMIDTHVHFMDPGDSSREDFLSGSAAAACAGVTTVVEHTHSHPVRTRDDFAEKVEHLDGRSFVDYGLAAHAWPDRTAELGALWRAGVIYIKAFTCTTHGVPGFDAAHLSELLRVGAAVGARCLVHCEDESMTGYAEANLREAGRDDRGIICEWRNREAEATATLVTAFLAGWHHARVVIAHASNPRILDLVGRERRCGADVVAESCPQYFLLREDELLNLGPFRKFTPPARAQSRAELDAMWAALATGEVHHISSDHAPSTPSQKTAGDIWDVHFGLPGIDTTLSVLLDAAARGSISYERIADAYAAAPARLYGLATRKGAVAEGMDADLVLVDPTLEWTVDDTDVRSRAGWSPFSGRTFTGRAAQTFVRGELVAADRELRTERPTGRLVLGPGAGSS